jgi:hypothetical protein
MKKHSLIACQLFFVFLFSTLCFSQKRSCGMDEYMKIQMLNPEYAKQHQELQQRFETEFLKTKSKNAIEKRRSTITIPVAIHFPEGVEENRDCLVELSYNQIAVLNNDFMGTNSDRVLWQTASSFYPGISLGQINIKFVIATQNHPANTDLDLMEGQPAVTIGYNFGDGGYDDSNWSGYVNIVIKTLVNELGSSPLGGNVALGETVEISPSNFGTGSGCEGYVPQEPYHLGRTVTHELGHFFNLKHTFTSSCNSDDGIEDTPNISEATYNCPAAGSLDSCVDGTPTLSMNYMDYVNDPCMYLFSEGQKTVVESYIATIETQFKTDFISTNKGLFDRLSISPNPSTGKFTITFPTNSTTETKISVFDLSGREIYYEEFKNQNRISQTIHLFQAQAGVYFINIHNGDKQICKRIIIK